MTSGLQHRIEDLKNQGPNGCLLGCIGLPAFLSIISAFIIPYLDILSGNALRTQSVNTICMKGGKLIGYNTDIDGFEISIKKLNYDVKDKTVIILGAGGVVPSIVYALKKMNASKIILSNRTREKAEALKNIFKDLNVLDWGEIVDFDMIINATSLGLKENDKFGTDFKSGGKNKLFYDVIYDPCETEFSDAARITGNNYENGLNMFLFQAQKAFNIWHHIDPIINDDLIKFLKKSLIKITSKKMRFKGLHIFFRVFLFILSQAWEFGGHTWKICRRGDQLIEVFDSIVVFFCPSTCVMGGQTRFINHPLYQVGKLVRKVVEPSWEKRSMAGWTLSLGILSCSTKKLKTYSMGNAGGRRWAPA